MLSDDSNSQREVISVCLLASEDDSMKWMIDVLKKYTTEWKRIRVVMADKNIGEQDVIKQCLLNSSVLICFFHTLRSFRRKKYVRR